MAITQLGISTASPELIEYLKTQAKSDLLIDDITDFPDELGQGGKFLGVTGDPGAPGGETIAWNDIPPSGLIWTNADADLTATVSTGYLVSGGITITLPESPEEGAIVAIADDKSELDVNPLTILGNGADLIQGDNELSVDMRNACFQLIFDGIEWRITQLNHPVNVVSITEESLPAGQTVYTLGRIPPTRESILVIENGGIIPASQYTLTGNQLNFGTTRNYPISIRYIGLPGTAQSVDVPVGMIGMFPRNRILEGWVIAAGGSISRSIYPDLVDYLTGDPSAQTAVLPDYRNLYFKGWSGAVGSVAPYAIPTDISDNRFGTWMPSLEVQRAAGVWEGNNTNTARVDFTKGYVGYTFDGQVSPTSVTLSTWHTGSPSFMPINVKLQSSDNGQDWTDHGGFVSLKNDAQGGGTNVFNVTAGTYHRQWRVIGQGGSDSGDGYYWEIGYMTFQGSGAISWNPVSMKRTSTPAIHDHDVTALTPTEYGDLPAGSGTFVAQAVDGSPITVDTTSLSANEPSNSEVVICIKAFNTQSGSIANTEVESLRTEVNRLSTIHQDIFSQDADIIGTWNIDSVRGGSLSITSANGTFPVLTAEDGSGKITWNIVTSSPAVEVAVDEGYMIDVTAGPIIIKLPTASSPTPPLQNDFVVVADYNGLIDQTRTVTVNPQGIPINGVVDGFVIDVKNTQFTFTYIDAIQGWRITNGLGESEAPSAIRDRVEFTNVAGHQTFSVKYEVGYVDVYRDGRHLSTTEFTATNGTTITLAEAVSDNSEVVTVIGYNHVPIQDGAYVLPYKQGKSIGTFLDERDNPTELINGYFQIWQRTGDTTDNGDPIWTLNGANVEKYGPDRWVAVGRQQNAGAEMRRITHTGNMNALPGITRRRYTVRVTSATAGVAEDTMAIEQRIEGVETFAGRDTTLTFTYKTDLPEISMQVGRYYGSTGGTPGPSEHDVFIQKITTIADSGWHTTSVLIPLRTLQLSTIGTDNNDYLSYTFWISSGSDYDTRTDFLGTQSGYFELAETKLELGTTPTPLLAPYAQDELDRAHRYYWYNQNSGAEIGMASSYYDNSSSNRLTIRHPVKMRSIPAASINFTSMPGVTVSKVDTDFLHLYGATPFRYEAFGDYLECDAEL